MRQFFLLTLAVIAALVASQAMSVIRGPEVSGFHLSCEEDSPSAGVNVAYETAFSATPSPGYKVTGVVVSNIPESCEHFHLTASLFEGLSGTDLLVESNAVRIDVTEMSLTFADPDAAPAKLVTRVALSIDDNRNETQITIELSADLVEAGTPVTATATLSGHTTGADGEDPATGDILYNVYLTPDCSGDVHQALGEFAVISATDPAEQTTSNPFTPAGAGSYYFQAEYTGDLEDADPGNRESTSDCVKLGATGPIYLQGNVTGDGDGCGDGHQLNGINPGGGNASVTVGLDSSETWVNHPGTSNFSTIGAGDYAVTLQRQAPPAASNFTVEIGYCAGGTFTSLGSVNSRFTGGPTAVTTVDVNIGATHELESGQRFALQIANLETRPANKVINLSTNGASFIVGPVH